MTMCGIINLPVALIIFGIPLFITVFSYFKLRKTIKNKVWLFIVLFFILLALFILASFIVTLTGLDCTGSGIEFEGVSLR